MQLIIPTELAARLKAELTSAGRREMGGILMGQNVGHDVFRVLEMTFQQSDQHACFSRSSGMHNRILKRFLRRTGKRYTEFNYIGEWHSHPCFALRPSETDHITMDTLVRIDLALPFAALLLVNIDAHDRIQYKAYVYTNSGCHQNASVRVEGESLASAKHIDWVTGLMRWLGL
jgi:hypothetical protein